MIFSSAEELIGSTPLVEVKKIEGELGIRARLLVKLECFNLAGSVKDRVALALIEDAEKKGMLKAGGTVVEPTSGNTGIGLAAVCAMRGYRAVLVMPDTMSVERRKLIRAYGAEIVLTDGTLGMRGAVDRAKEIAKQTENCILAGQFENPSNPRAHYLGTGPEIWKDTKGEIAAFVAGVGTGGTLSGAGRFLKEKDESIRLVAVEPADSPLLSEGRAGPHRIQGIGANFVPDTLDRSLIDEIIAVTADEAYDSARLLAKREGILVGISSGAAISAAIRLCRREEFFGKNIVALLPDSGERYLSTDLYQEC